MSDHGRLTLTAFKWVPPLVQGQVRDFRIRWMLREIGWPYEVDLIDSPTLATDAYRAEHPFGQVPLLREEGRPALFESGGIVLDLAERSGRLLPEDRDQRALVKCWTYAALNSVEPFLLQVEFVNHFVEDKVAAEGYRPFAEKLAHGRLAKLDAALSGKTWLVDDDFSIADLMMASVVKIGGDAKLADAYPAIVAWHARCLARPAYRAAIAEQDGEYADHGPDDMGFDKPAAAA